MAHLAVTHLVLGETDRQSTGVEQSARCTGSEPVPDRRIGQGDGVPVPGFAVAPAVEDHEQHRRGTLAGV